MQKVPTSSTTVLASYLFPTETMPQGSLAARISVIPRVTQDLVKRGSSLGLSAFLYNELEYYQTIANTQSQAQRVLLALQAPSAVIKPATGKTIATLEPVLSGQIPKIQELVTLMKTHLNSTAYELRKMEGKTSWGDWIPSMGYSYFDQAFAEYQQAKLQKLNPTSDLSKTSATHVISTTDATKTSVTPETSSTPPTTPPLSPHAAPQTSIASTASLEPPPEDLTTSTVFIAEIATLEPPPEDLTASSISTTATEDLELPPIEQADLLPTVLSVPVAAKSVDEALKDLASTISPTPVAAKIALTPQRAKPVAPPPLKIDGGKAPSEQKKPDSENGKKNPGGATIHRRSLASTKTIPS